MTIEERAKELGHKFARQYHHNTCFLEKDKSFVYSNEEITDACIEMAYEQMKLCDSELVNTSLKAYNNGVHDTIEKALKVYEELMTCSGYFPETITAELARMRNKLEG